jgi:hypothetical protein
MINQNPPPREWPDEDHDLVLNGHYLEVAAKEIESAGSSNLYSMRAALVVLMYDKRVSEMLVPIMPALIEIDLALAMAAAGVRHPALEVKTKPYGGRGYTAVQTCLIEMLFVASEVLFAMDYSRKDADKQVVEWAKDTAERLNVAFGAKKKGPLTDKRTELDWLARWQDHPMRLALKYAQKEGQLQWWSDYYQRSIKNFDDRQAYS